MKRRLFAAGVLLALTLSLCACAKGSESSRLKGKRTKYSETVAFAQAAWGGVQVVESDEKSTLKNQTAQLDFDPTNGEFTSMTSLQTGEVILQNAIQTQITTKDKAVGQIVGGTNGVYQGNYGVSHAQTSASLRYDASPKDAKILKEYDLTDEDMKTSFSALKNDVQITDADSLRVTSKGKIRSQFGARYLNLDLGNADRYYLSVTVKAESISGLKCYFSTSDAPLTEDTLLGTISLNDAQGGEFVTLTAEIKNELWEGTLQTLLFRFPEDETGTVELSRIALLTANDPVTENAADTYWTVYSDRIYFSQTLKNKEGFLSAATVISIPKAKCIEMEETEHAVALKLIDGSILGFVRPSDGTLTVAQQAEEIQLTLRWDLSKEEPFIALRIYLNYTDETAELQKIAQEERTPLTAEALSLEGATLEGYDAKYGIYRLKQTKESVTVTLNKCDRALYLHLPPAEQRGWRVSDEKGNRLPLFAGDTFPLCGNGKKLTVQLSAESATEQATLPAFLSDLDLTEQSDSAFAVNGLYAQKTADYLSPDGNYSLTVTATKAEGGRGTVYDVEYRFHAKTEISDLCNAFPLFSFEAGDEFNEYFYLNEENKLTNASAGDEAISSLGTTPFVGVYTDQSTVGWLVSTARVTAEGASVAVPLCLRYEKATEDAASKLYLSVALSEITFIKGDTVTAQVICRGDASDAESLQALRDGGNFQLIHAESKKIEAFTVNGMEETTVVQIEGFNRYTFPKITANGEKFVPERYQVYVDEDGYFGFAFAVETGTELKMKD